MTIHYTRTHDEQVKRKRGRRKRGRRNAQEPAVVKKRVGVVVVGCIQASVNPFSPLGMTHAHTEGARSVKLLDNQESKDDD